MNTLTEQGAELLIAGSALTPSRPGFVGAEVDLLLSRPGLPAPLAGALTRDRVRLRHGFLAARSARVAVVSGPPSPGPDTAVDRMTEDLAIPVPLFAGHGIAVLSEASDGGFTSATDGTAGVRVSLEAGVEQDGLFGLRRRWTLAHALAPVLAAAFANSPLRDGRPTGWKSARQATRRLARPTADPRSDWAALVLDGPVAGDGRTFREWTRADGRPDVADLRPHLATVRPRSPRAGTSRSTSPTVSPARAGAYPSPSSPPCSTNPAPPCRRSPSPSRYVTGPDCGNVRHATGSATRSSRGWPGGCSSRRTRG